MTSYIEFLVRTLTRYNIIESMLNKKLLFQSNIFNPTVHNVYIVKLKTAVLSKINDFFQNTLKGFITRKKIYFCIKLIHIVVKHKMKIL